MTPQLLTIAAELRLKIYDLALLDTTISTSSVGEDIRYEEIIIADERQYDNAKASSSISLLLVCKQVNAEVSPIFYNHVRLHLSPWGCNDDWGEFDLGLRHFALQDLMKAPRAVKKMSICTVLARQLAEGDTIKALETMFARALPHLQNLIVYDERVYYDLDYNPKHKNAKQNAIAFVRSLYTDMDFDSWSGLHKLLPTKDRTFTVTQQVSLSIGEVCIATKTPDAQDFQYRFCSIEQAVIKADETKNRGF